MTAVRAAAAAETPAGGHVDSRIQVGWSSGRRQLLGGERRGGDGGWGERPPRHWMGTCVCVRARVWTSVLTCLPPSLPLNPVPPPPDPSPLFPHKSFTIPLSQSRYLSTLPASVLNPHLQLKKMKSALPTLPRSPLPTGSLPQSFLRPNLLSPYSAYHPALTPFSLSSLHS